MRSRTAGRHAAGHTGRVTATRTQAMQHKAIEAFGVVGVGVGGVLRCACKRGQVGRAAGGAGGAPHLLVLVVGPSAAATATAVARPQVGLAVIDEAVVCGAGRGGAGRGGGEGGKQVHSSPPCANRWCGMVGCFDTSGVVMGVCVVVGGSGSSAGPPLYFSKRLADPSRLKRKERGLERTATLLITIAQHYVP